MKIHITSGFIFILCLVSLNLFHFVAIAQPTVPLDSCYEKFENFGIIRFEKGDYQKAYDNFIAANDCDCLPLQNKLSEWIDKSNRCLENFKLAEEQFEMENYPEAQLYYERIIKLNSKDSYSAKKLNLCQNKQELSPDMILVKGGRFLMGCNTGHMNEQPEHEVILQGFYMDKYEVTNRQYALFLNQKGNQIENNTPWMDLNDNDCKIELVNGSYKVKKGFENYPVIEISWYGANAYALFHGKRLPTEAEWEFAARGGIFSRSSKFAGSNNPDSIAWFRDNSNFEVKPVGSKRPNELGIYDLSGNAWEWCNDWYGPNYYFLSPSESPEGTNFGEYKVMRGGAGSTYPDFLRNTCRNFNLPTDSYTNYGFRCVKSVDK